MTSGYPGSDALLESIRINFAQCVFNHQVYRRAATRERRKENLIKLASLTSTIIALIVLILPNKEDGALTILGALSTVAGVGIQLFQWLFEIGERSRSYKKTADDFLELREKYLCLIADYKSGLGAKDLRRRRDELTQEYHNISENALESTMKDYRKAQKMLDTRSAKNGQIEAYTWSKEEIDRFLPEKLR